MAILIASQDLESRDNRSPFDLGSRFHVIAPTDLTKYSGPKICFVSQVETLVDEVISRLCQTERTTIILTSSDNDDTRTLSVLHKNWDLAQKQRGAEEGQSISYSESLTLKTVQTKPMTGEELEQYVAGITERKTKRKELEESLHKDVKLAGKISRRLDGKDDSGNMREDGQDPEEDDDED